MGQIAKFLRLLVNADQEAKITVVDVTSTPTQFSTQLTSEQTRRRIGVYNSSNPASGECYFSFSETASPSGESMVIRKGVSGETLRYIPIADHANIELYFFCDAGEVGELRVIELA